MKKIIVIAVCALVLVGCGSPKVETDISYYDELFTTNGYELTSESEENNNGDLINKYEKIVIHEDDEKLKDVYEFFVFHDGDEVIGLRGFYEPDKQYSFSRDNYIIKSFVKEETVRYMNSKRDADDEEYICEYNIDKDEITGCNDNSKELVKDMLSTLEKEAKELGIDHVIFETGY